MNIVLNGQTDDRMDDQTDYQTDGWIVGKTNSWFAQLLSVEYFVCITYYVSFEAG